MTEEKISIIIPIFNGEKIIERCLSSVRNQCYSNIEIIVIDDGSSDSTYSICKSIANKDARVSVFKKNNGGVSSARNYGISKASGKYMMFLDGDDTIEAHYFETFMKVKDYIDQKIVVIARIDTYVDGEYIPESTPRLVEDDVILDANRIEDIWEAHLWNSPVNKVYISEVVKSNKILFDCDFSIGEDWLFNNQYVRCLRPTGYYILGDIRYRYYMDADPWRHCSRKDFYKINKYQVEDFKRTLRELNIRDSELNKFEKRDIDFTISEIRYLVRDRDDLSVWRRIRTSRELFEKEELKKRLKWHKNNYPFMDYLEFSVGSMFFVFIWENIRKQIGKLKGKI